MLTAPIGRWTPGDDCGRGGLTEVRPMLPLSVA